MNQEVIAIEKVQETIPAIEIQTKQCKRKECLKFKPVKEFPVSKIMPDGYNSYCKECLNKYQRKYYLKRNEQKLAVKYYYDDPTTGLRQCQCQQSSCKKFKPISEFGVSMSYADGYSPFCKTCILRASLKDAINKELAQKAKENYVHPDDIIFRPIPFDDFCKLKLISREHPPISEYFIGRKIKNPYQLPTEDEYIHTDEFVCGEPSSSHKDFLVLNEKNHIPYDTKMILEDRGELVYATKQLQLLVKNGHGS